MKLFHSPGACSLAADIALREAGLAFDLEQVDLATKKTHSGADFTAINPKGYVPALQLDDGQILTENVAILPYVADLRPAKNLAPRIGTIERLRFEEWLGFVSTEIHKAFGPFFDKRMPENAQELAREKLRKRLAFLDRHLQRSTYLMGDTFTVVDGYLFTVLRWTKAAAIDLRPFPGVLSFVGRVGDRNLVDAAIAAEARGETHAEPAVAA